jgi:endonuclease/exonuclease/phosphatase family metal-dependent hydrolase
MEIKVIMYNNRLLLFFVLLVNCFGFSQGFKYTLDWEQQSLTDANGANFVFSQVKDCGLDNGVPFFFAKEEVKFKNAEVKVKAMNFEVAPEIDKKHFSYLNYELSEEVKMNFKVTSAGSENYFVFHAIPYKLVNNQLQRLKSIEFEVIKKSDIVVEKDTVRVFNVHLQSLRFSVLHKAYLENPGLNTEEDKRTSLNILEKFKLAFQRRKLQADRIRIEIDKSPYPVLVCGDFNDVPNSYAYEIIGKHLQNAFVAKGAGLGRTYQSISPTLRIDHIFTDKQFSIRQFGRLVNKLSDHYALVTDLQTPSAQP